MHAEFLQSWETSETTLYTLNNHDVLTIDHFFSSWLNLYITARNVHREG